MTPLSTRIATRVKGLQRWGGLSEETPHQVATAFAVGVFVAFCPLLGLHTILAIVLIWAFRLNKVVVFTGALINNPWTLTPITWVSLWLGTLIDPRPYALPSVDWGNLTLMALVRALQPYLFPFMLGGTLLSVLGAIVGYIVVYKWRVRIAAPSQSPADYP